MNRRELLTGAAALAAIATAGRAFAAEHDHSMHDHHAMSSRNDKLIAAATDCVTKANLCLQHCL
ncbi:MAG: four-helix bundle copper-binding protein, partial [Gammaproteobacteria bacterium]|nr:four-helix bundle copper-binding protein [Gammaproteobacteria bacterium]